MSQAVFNIRGFCRDHCLSIPSYYKLKREGLGPAEMRLGTTVRISMEAAAAWRRARENPTGAEAEAVARIESERRARAQKAARSAIASDRHISKRRASA